MSTTSLESAYWATPADLAPATLERTERRVVGYLCRCGRTWRTSQPSAPMCGGIACGRVMRAVRAGDRDAWRFAEPTCSFCGTIHARNSSC